MSDAAVIGTALYAGAVGLVLIGFYAVVVMRHLMRILLGLTLLEGGVNLFLVATGFRPEAAAPILVGGKAPGPMVDPVPQALVLTAIVIGVGVLALALALVVRAYRAYGTLDTRALAMKVQEEGPEVPRLPRGKPALPEERG